MHKPIHFGQWTCICKWNWPFELKINRGHLPVLSELHQPIKHGESELKSLINRCLTVPIGQNITWSRYFYDKSGYKFHFRSATFVKKMNGHCKFDWNFSKSKEHNSLKNCLIIPKRYSYDKSGYQISFQYVRHLWNGNYW